MPYAGALIFLDYTPAQINSMLTAGQISNAQAIYLRQLSTYGAYDMITGGYSWQPFTLSSEFQEGSYAWTYAGLTDPFTAWGCANGMNDLNLPGCSGGKLTTGNYYPSLSVIGGIPRLTGPGGTDISGNSCATAPGCDVSGHIHVADPCIPEGMVGMAGGCQ